MTYELDRTALIPAPRDKVFSFFEDPNNLYKLTPEELGLQITHLDDLPVRRDFRIEYTIKWLFVRLKWVTRITQYEPPELFADIQEEGPYQSWRHEHFFEEAGDQTIMRDHVQYELPFGILGSVAHRVLVADQLRQIFDYRAHAIRDIFAKPGHDESLEDA